MNVSVKELLQHAIKAHRNKNFNEAARLYRIILIFVPNHSDATHNLGVLFQDKGKDDDATFLFKKAVEIDCSRPQFLASYITVLLDLNIPITGDQIVSNASKNHNAIYYQELAQILNNSGVKRKKANFYTTAKYFYHYALLFKPDDSIALNNLGNLSLEMKNMPIAYLSYKKAICLKPQLAEAYTNLADYFFKLQKYEASLYILSKSLKINSRSPLTYLNQGNALTQMGHVDDILKSYKKSQMLDPGFSLASYNLGNIYFDKLFQIQVAMSEYRKASLIQASHSQAVVWLMYLKAITCEWAVKEYEFRSDLDKLAELGLNSDIISPFTALSLEDRPDRHKIRSENYAKSLVSPKATLAFSKINHEKNRITIAYFSLYLPSDPVFNLIKKIFRSHDRKRFKVTAYLLTNNLPFDHLQKLYELFDTVTLIEGLSDPEVSALSRKNGVDIAVDLLGYTRGGRSGIFSHRAAPIQINFLGYPGTSGANFFDYIVADKTLIPIKNQIFFSEKVIYLPGSYQPQDDEKIFSKEEITRTSIGLPQDAFVFCCFHNTYKIMPEEFRIWLRLLKNVNNSVLWLLKTNGFVEENLQFLAKKNGINPTRLIFFTRMGYPEYLSRLSVADLFLDTFNYNAGATASDALWAGVPVVTKTGLGYPARMASSLLKALNLPELIANSPEAYENIVYQLATDKEKFNKVRKKVKSNVKTQPLFNSKLYTYHLEKGYQLALQSWLNGEKCNHIVVDKS